jgi:tRNA-Thr(GGU) m(6)t(6)A37 methyltransferase TsaA
MGGDEIVNGRELRAGEVSVDLPERCDAGLHFIGRIRTPFASLEDCPKNTRASSAEATVEVDERYAAGLAGVELFSHLILLYWLDQSRRDLLVQAPRHLEAPRGTFSLRSPVRPNPIGLAVVELLGVERNRLRVRSIDCRDGTPLIDVKPYFASTDSVPDARRPRVPMR